MKRKSVDELKLLYPDLVARIVEEARVNALQERIRGLERRFERVQEETRQTPTDRAAIREAERLIEEGARMGLTPEETVKRVRDARAFRRLVQIFNG